MKTPPAPKKRTGRLGTTSDGLILNITPNTPEELIPYIYAAHAHAAAVHFSAEVIQGGNDYVELRHSCAELARQQRIASARVRANEVMEHERVSPHTVASSILFNPKLHSRSASPLRHPWNPLELGS